MDKYKNFILLSIMYCFVFSLILVMGFPGWPKNPNPAVKYNSREIVAAFLETHHKDHFMIFNLSDEVYDSILFGDHVLMFLAGYSDCLL